MNLPQTPQNPSRRRLAKGAVAVPAVLASISAKNALASPIYGCTVSGQMSGNTSPAGRDLNPDCGGKTAEQWRNEYKQDGKKNLTGVPSWLGVVRNSGSGDVKRSEVFGKSSKVTFHYDQQLTLNAFAVYCNAETLGNSYHVTTEECRDLFLVAVGMGGGVYAKNGKQWLPGQCADFLALLVA